LEEALDLSFDRLLMMMMMVTIPISTTRLNTQTYYILPKLDIFMCFAWI